MQIIVAGIQSSRILLMYLLTDKKKEKRGLINENSKQKNLISSHSHGAVGCINTPLESTFCLLVVVILWGNIYDDQYFRPYSPTESVVKIELRLRFWLVFLSFAGPD